jgi:hypothetical protein
MPTLREIRERKKRPIECDHFLKSDNAPIFNARRVPSEKLPAVVVEIVCHMEHRLRSLKYLTNCNDRAVARLIKRPTV